MPVRIGFTKFRQQMLEQELENIQGLLPTLGVEKVILTGDMITGNYSPDSRIDLIIVHDTDRPFGRRADFFSYHLGSGVEVDTLVYTPDEFDSLRATLPALHAACEKGRVIYNA
jgi:predicted nucleotidyltransferase